MPSSPLLNLLPPWLRGATRVLRGLGAVFLAAKQSPARGPVPGPAPRDERLDLTATTRQELVKRGRHLMRNSGQARQLALDMQLFAVGHGIRPQPRSRQPEWNRAALEVWRRWGQRADITGRFSIANIQALACRSLERDGELFVLLVENAGEPSLQLIESHRVGGGDVAAGWHDGIRFDTVGRPIAYRIRLTADTWQEVPAPSVLHLYEVEAASSARYAPTLQHSIPNFLDEFELLALEKHAVKSNADIARVVFTEGGEGAGLDFSAINDSPEATAARTEKIIGGKVVGLKIGEDIKAFESNRPNPTFTGFLEHLKRETAAGNLPYEFTSQPSVAGGAAIRLVVAKADRRFQDRQQTLIERLLLPVWGWVMGHAIAAGTLPDVPDWDRVDWITPRRVTVDAGREAAQHREDVLTGLTTLEDHYEELGSSFEDESRTRASNMRFLLDLAKEYAVPFELLYRLSPNPSPAAGAKPAPDDKAASDAEEEEDKPKADPEDKPRR